MAEPTIAYITNSLVNSGNKINLNADKISTNWEVFSKVKEQPRTSVGSSYTDSLPTSRNTGISSPTHTVSCYYNSNETHSTGDGALIDREYIEELINNSQVTMTLRCSKYKTTTNTNGDITVRLVSYSDITDNTNITNFTLTFREVKS